MYGMGYLGKRIKHERKEKTNRMTKHEKRETPAEELAEHRGKDYFMQELTEEQEEKGTKGALHRMLGVPESYNMGDMMSLLEKIKDTPLEHTIKNHLTHGKRLIKVTPLLKKRAVSAWVRINAARGKYKK